MTLVLLAALLLLPALPPETLRLEYRLSETGRLAIAWPGPAGPGHLTRQLTAEDVAVLASLARAVNEPGSEWRTPANRAADLLLGGIEPLGAVKRLLIAIPQGALLRRIPFETLGSPPLIERFTVWYEPPGGQDAAAALIRLWTVPGETSTPFLRRYEERLHTGLEPSEALRLVKVEWLNSAAAKRQHPFYWAAFTLQGTLPSPATGRTIPWIWAVGFSAALGGAALLVWWRRERFELL